MLWLASIPTSRNQGVRVGGNIRGGGEGAQQPRVICSRYTLSQVYFSSNCFMEVGLCFVVYRLWLHLDKFVG